MTLTPEQIARGWKLHDGSDVCPIKDDLAAHEVMFKGGALHAATGDPKQWQWMWITAYRIIEAHGADAEPARPTPFPASMDDLVYDEDGFSQPFMTGGTWPEWLPDDAEWQFAPGGFAWHGRKAFDGEFAIRVRRREPKRETVEGTLSCQGNFWRVSYDLIDGQPDLSTLKIAEDAL